MSYLKESEMSTQEKKQFYIGDGVVISARGYHYDTYNWAAEKMGLSDWQPYQDYKIGDEGVVVAICSHEDSGCELYGLLMKSGKQYIFEADGLSHAGKKYALHLSEEEKDVLFCMLGTVGGMPDTSPRKYAQAVYDRMFQWSTFDDSGVFPKYYNMLEEDEKALRFKDFPTPIEKNTMNLKVELDTTDVKKDIEELKVLFEQIEAIENRIFKGE